MPRVIDSIQCFMYTCRINRNLLSICSLFDVYIVENYNEKLPNELDKAVDKLHHDCTNKKTPINAFSY